MVVKRRNRPRARWIQFTAPVSKGNSGGPLIGDQGEVVGIVSRYMSIGQNLNFAVSSIEVIRLLERSKKNGTRFLALPGLTPKQTAAKESPTSRLPTSTESKKTKEDSEVEESERSLRQDVAKAYDEEKKAWLREVRALNAQQRREELRKREQLQRAATEKSINDAQRRFFEQMNPYRSR